MTYFPVTNSNLSAMHVGLFLKDKYLLSKETRCNIIKAGINDTYLVTGNSEQYVFRVYSLHWRTITEIQEEIKLLNQLKLHSISISYPLPDKDNNFIQVLDAPEGERFAVLFSFAKGEKNHSYSEEIHFQIGVLMAQIHKLTNGMSLKRVTYSPDVLIIESLKQIEKFLSQDTAEMEFLQSSQKYLLEEFSKADINELRQGVVHLDIWFDNLNITKENIVTIFDFDFIGNGWLCLDIAYYILQVNSTEKIEAECKIKVAGFLNGYESIIEISSEEKRLIPMLGISIYFFYLGIQCKRYDNWSNSFLSEDYLKRFINILVKKYYNANNLGVRKEN